MMYAYYLYSSFVLGSILSYGETVGSLLVMVSTSKWVITCESGDGPM